MIVITGHLARLPSIYARKIFNIMKEDTVTVEYLTDHQLKTFNFLTLKEFFNQAFDWLLSGAKDGSVYAFRGTSSDIVTGVYLHQYTHFYHPVYNDNQYLINWDFDNDVQVEIDKLVSRGYREIGPVWKLKPSRGNLSRYSTEAIFHNLADAIAALIEEFE